MKTMTTNKKLLSLTALTAVLGASFVGMQNANAQATENLHATAQFQKALVTNKVDDMDFATIGVITAGDPTAGTAQLNTDGSIVYDTVELDGSGAGTAGLIQITDGSLGVDINIFCDDLATLAAGTGNTIDVEDVGFDINGPSTSVGAFDCVDQSTASTDFQQTGGFSANITFGGILKGSTIGGTFEPEGLYDSSNPGGDPVTVTVAYK